MTRFICDRTLVCSGRSSDRESSEEDGDDDDGDGDDGDDLNTLHTLSGVLTESLL